MEDDFFEKRGTVEAPKVEPAPPKPGRDARLGCAIASAAILLTFFPWFLTTCTGSASRREAISEPVMSPEIAAAAEQALGPLSAVVDGISAGSDGFVAITLSKTSESLAGDSGTNGANRIGASYAEIVLNAVPAAQTVAVFDADNHMIGNRTRSVP